MNTADMITMLGQRYRDPRFLTIPRTRWLEYVNQAQRRFIKRSRFPMSSSFTTIAFAAGDTSKDLPVDVWGVRSVWDDTNNIPLYPMYHRDQQGHLFDGSAGTVEAFTIEDNKLYLFAVPRTAIDIKVLGTSVVASLTDAIGSTSRLPEHYHHAIQEGALEAAYRESRNLELAASHKQVFDEALADATHEFAQPVGGRNVPVRNDAFSTGMRPFRGR